MSKHSLTYNDDSLMALLRDELPRGESDTILDHLEICIDCQQRISDLVASSDEWQQAVEAISGYSKHADDVKIDSVPFPGLQQIAWTDSMARQLLSPPSHPEMLGRLGRYEVERLIGSGGMGVVFKAFDSELNRPVAIKLLAPYLASSGPARKRFSREARAAAAVVHQHVVPIHNVETDRESPFIVMQYVSGESLQARIDREGPLELCEVLRIGMQAADGLGAAHLQGLVHRDIKPSNILLEEDVDRALISDFGLARAADDAALTRTGFHPGTPQYMSPEQASGQSVDARSDLFSLGSMLYTMSTGRPPFRAESSLGVMRRITETEPTPIRDLNPAIPDWLCRIIAKLMDKQKAGRFQSAGEVHQLLEECLSHVQQPSAAELPASLISFNRVTGAENNLANFFRSKTGVFTLVTLCVVAAIVGLMQIPGTHRQDTREDAVAGAAVSQSDMVEAVRKASPDTIAEMIANGAPIDAESRTGQSALQIAAMARRSEVVNLLIGAGADIHHNVLHSAAEGGDPEIIDILISKGARINADSGVGTPLKYAAWNGQKAAVEKLVEKGANVDSRAQQSGRTPLRYAVWGSWKHPKQALEIAQILLDAGAAPDSVADDGLTPVHEAALRNADKLLLLLLEQGADINRKVVSTGSFNGMTALDIAQKHEHLALMVLIRKHGGKLGQDLLASDLPAAGVEKTPVADAMHFQRLCQLRVAYQRRYAAIVQTIRDETTAKAAANSYADLAPLKSEMYHLGRMLRRYEPGSKQNSLLEKTQQKIDSLNQSIVRATLKVRDEPFFKIFGTSFQDVNRSAGALKPVPVPEGHALRGDGPQFVVWLPPEGKGEIDLSKEEGKLEVFDVNQQTGELTAQREYISCGGMAMLPTTVSEFGTLLWLRPLPGSVDAEPKVDKSAMLTWKDLLGKDAPPDYPTAPLSLIAALNNSRGEWVFAGTLNGGERDSDFEAAVKVQGGFGKMIRQDSFPQWRVGINWPREEATSFLGFLIVALPEADGIKWTLTPHHASKGQGPVRGQHKMYQGSWNPQTATVTWTSAQIQSPLKKNDAAEKPESPNESKSTFDMVVKANGEIQIKGYQNTESLSFSVNAAVRIGEPYVEKKPAIAKLPGGYKIFFASRTEVCLDSATGPIIAGPRIKKIGCEGDLIFGLTTVYDNSKQRSDTLGYFWLDTTTGQITKGMNLTAWKEALKANGVDEPRLVDPQDIGGQN